MKIGDMVSHEEFGPVKICGGPYYDQEGEWFGIVMIHGEIRISLSGYLQPFRNSVGSPHD